MAAAGSVFHRQLACFGAALAPIWPASPNPSRFPPTRQRPASRTRRDVSLVHDAFVANRRDVPHLQRGQRPQCDVAQSLPFQYPAARRLIEPEQTGAVPRRGLGAWRTSPNLLAVGRCSIVRQPPGNQNDVGRASSSERCVRRRTKHRNRNESAAGACQTNRTSALASSAGTSYGPMKSIAVKPCRYRRWRPACCSPLVRKPTSCGPVSGEITQPSNEIAAQRFRRCRPQRPRSRHGVVGLLSVDDRLRFRILST